MSAAAQRTWHRIETPQTFRGHSLRAQLYGRDFVAWENRDGSWTLTEGGDPRTAQIYRDWTATRRVAESAPLENPVKLDPHIESAAMTGTLMTLRTLLPNPAPNPCQVAVVRTAAVYGVIPPAWLTGPPQWTRAGTLVVRVRAGFGGQTLARLRGAGVSFPVDVIEGDAARRGNPGAPPDVEAVLAALRAAYFTHRNAHWQVQGTGHYGNHLLLQRIYEESEKDTDTWAEQMVGSFGSDAVTLAGAQLDQINADVARFEAEPSPLHRSFAAVLELRARLARAYASMQAAGQLSLGWDDIIMSIASSNDKHVYLLQQALGIPPAQIGNYR